MVCENCGAHYDDELLLCPYCNAENSHVAKMEQHRYVKKYEDKIKDLKKMPDRVVRRTTGILVKAAAVLSYIYGLKEEGFLYEEGQAMRGFEKNYEGVLKEVYKMTDEV